MKQRKILLLAAVCCGLLSMVICSPAVAQPYVGLGVNFVGGHTAISSGVGFGYIGHTGWSNAAGVSGGPQAAPTQYGGGSATVSWTSASLGAVGTVNNDPNVSNDACNGCTGPQDGASDALKGFIRAQNSFGTTGPQISITLTGLADIFDDYDVYVYFNSTEDQGDQYEVLYDDGVNPVIAQYPVSPTPLVNSQGRSAGGFYGYDDNGTAIGNASGFATTGEDSVAATSAGVVLGGAGALTGDTLVVTISDLNNNGNNNTPSGLGGPNYGPNADLGVAAIQIIGTVPEPASIVLLGLGLVGLAGLGLRRRKR